jgi:hypothetical protein
MGQIILLGLAAIGGYYVYKAVRREFDRVGGELKKSRDAATGKPTETLELDPKTGRYRPKQQD